MIRRAIERVSRGLVLKRRLPPKFGGDVLFVSPESALSFWKRDQERAFGDILGFAAEFVRPGDTVWDVGANMGVFVFASSFLAGRSGSVVAMEPDLFSVSLMRRSVSASSPDRASVNTLPVAVSDQVGLGDFHVARRGRSMSHLASVPGAPEDASGGVKETSSVITVTLDWLLERLPAPTVLKIDVEGAELAVLKGAEKLLSEHKPVILCEVWKANAEECTNILKKHGYLLYDFADASRKPLECAVWNTLAIAAPPQ